MKNVRICLLSIFFVYLAEGVVHGNALLVSSLLHPPSTILHSLPSMEAATTTTCNSTTNSNTSKGTADTDQNQQGED